jgi:hypothetical protein
MWAAMTKNVNWNRWMMAWVAMFFFFFASDFLIHGVWLQDTYHATQSMWRTEDDMHHFMPWMVFGQIMIAAFFTFIFARGYEGKGWQEGLRFGLLIGFLTSAPMFMNYAVMPMPMNLLWSWVFACFAQSIVGGILTGMVYKKK